MWMWQNDRLGPFHGPARYPSANPRLKPGATRFRRIRGGTHLRFARGASTARSPTLQRGVLSEPIPDRKVRRVSVDPANGRRK